MKKKLLPILFLLLILSLALAACAKSDAKISFAENVVDIHVGEEVTLSPVLENATGKEEIYWFTSDKYVAAVENGVLKGVSSGECAVTAAIPGSSAEIRVRVTYDAAFYPSISFASASMSVQLYDRVQLDPVLNKVSGTVTYTSSDEETLTAEKGLLVPKKAGVAVVTASADNCSASVEVTVVAESAVPTLQTDRSSVEMLIGQRFSLSPYVMYNGARQSFSGKFRSENANIAAVDADGTLSGVSVGQTNVVIDGEYNGFLFESLVVPVIVKEDVFLRLSATSLHLSTGELPESGYVTSETLTATVYVNGQRVTAPQITWQSGAELVASVANGTVTAASEGRAEITATYVYDGKNYSSSAEVTVFSPVLAAEKAEVDLSAASSALHFTLPSRFDGAKFLSLEIGGQEVAATAETGGIVLQKADVASLKGRQTLSVRCSDFRFEKEVLFITKSISSFADLQSIAVSGNTLDGYYVLTADIDCPDTTLRLVGTWSMSPYLGFLGTFDGRGHLIKNLNTVSGGLFYCIGASGVVKNLGLTNMRGEGTAISSENRGRISDVFVTSATKSYLCDLVEDGTLENAVFSLHAAGSCVVRYVYNSTCVLKNVYGVAEKFVFYDGAGIAPLGRLTDNFADVGADFAVRTPEQLGFNAEYWTVQNGLPLFTGYASVLQNFSVTNTVRTFPAYGSIQITTDVYDATFEIKKKINGISVSATGLLSSTREGDVVVIVTTPYGQSVEVTFTCTAA